MEFMVLFSKSLKMDFFQLKAGNILYDIRYGNAFTVIGLILSLLGFFSGELLYFVGLNYTFDSSHLTMTSGFLGIALIIIGASQKFLDAMKANSEKAKS
jgi:hypothetical protein